MITKDSNIYSIKSEVLMMVSKLAWSGELEENKDDIPYQIVSGHKPMFRCCTYKEREIARDRIKLYEGKCPSGKHSDNMVQVIDPACEECPIATVTITDNCQKCMEKACFGACNFGAISLGSKKAYIENDKCKECGKCVSACPYHAIIQVQRPCKRVCPVNAISYDEDGLCVIDNERCIQCGECIRSCPFGAIEAKSHVVNVIDTIRSGKKVYAMIAPAVEGQYGQEITFQSWRNALKEMGFEDLIELGLGGDMTAGYEAMEWAEAYKNGEKKTTSCCPAFVNMVKKHYPELMGHLSTTVSPMCGVSRLLKAKDPECITVFIGPCIAKKSEAMDHGIEGNADFVLTFTEIEAMMKAKGVELKPCEMGFQGASVYGKRFGNSGGVTNAVLQSMKELGVEDEVNVKVCNGASACKTALLMLKAGRLQEDFIEGMACTGGCVGGPRRAKEVMAAKKDRDALIAKADNRGVFENLSHYDMDSFSMHAVRK